MRQVLHQEHQSLPFQHQRTRFPCLLWVISRHKQVSLDSRRRGSPTVLLARHSSWFARTIRQQQISAKVDAQYAYTIKISDERVRLYPGIVEGRQGVEPLGQGDLAKPCIKNEAEEDEDHAAHESKINVYGQIFSSFYNIPPHITSTSIKRATSEAEVLAGVANDLGCIHLVSSHIGNALLQHRQALYKAIFDDPPRYLLLALVLENDFMYAESLIHLIGAYPYGTFPTSRKLLPDEMLRLMAKKSQELDKKVFEVERGLLLLTITIEPKKEAYRCDISWQLVRYMACGSTIPGHAGHCPAPA